MRGEPTLHPQWLTAVQLARIILPKSKITIVTNGSKLNVENVREFFVNGGNLLMVDCYGYSFDKLKKMLSKTGFNVKVHGDPGTKLWGYLPPTTKIILLMPDIRKDNSVTRNFTNQCDAISQRAYDKYNIKRVKEPLEKKCANPFREIAFHYNGDAPICCKDWIGSKVYYNVNSYIDGLQKYWFQDERLNMIRKLLYNKIRTFQPCQRCNFNGGFYLGFLPKLEKLSEYDKELFLTKLQKGDIHGH
jgi:MoaA/NifB/PqqE/SkfB family radical SAM enzyme